MGTVEDKAEESVNETLDDTGEFLKKLIDRSLGFIKLYLGEKIDQLSDTCKGNINTEETENELRKKEAPNSKEKGGDG